jgi:hypothetical protein
MTRDAGRRSSPAIVLAAALALLVIVSVALAPLPSRSRGPAGPEQADSGISLARAVVAPPFVMFRALAPRRAFGRVAMASPGRPLTRYLTTMSCARVQYAAGTGLCMVEEPEGKTVRQLLYVFDRQFVFQARILLGGIPIRARVSPDGRLASVTTYGEEESPAGERLASESILIDTRAGRVLGDLRHFAVDNPKGLPIEEPIDISSVAFTGDSDRFFATLSTPSNRYLISGTASARRITLIESGLANEAVSPDGTRLLVKKQTGARGFWQLVVLDLASKSEVPLNQGPRSVDDQVEWLNDGHVVYHDVTESGTGIWMLAADGTTGPQLLMKDAFSPAVQR